MPWEEVKVGFQDAGKMRKAFMKDFR